MSVEITSFVEAYTQAILDRNAAVFAGAGLSIPAGMVNWKSLMRHIAHDVGLDVGKEDDLVALAQYHVNKYGVRHKINQALVTEFCDRAKTTANHKILANLPIRTYWTTNYDQLIEQSLRAAGKRPDVKSTPENLAVTAHLRDVVVNKMHGDVDHPDQAVITKDDYETYQTTRQLFSTALQGDLVSKTFLFVGFSFNDPNLGYILARIRMLLGINQRQHYALLRRVHRRDFKKNSEFSYAKAKQELQVGDLTRYGIKGILVEEYEDYTQVFMDISTRYKRTRLFISGSAVTYLPWNEAHAEQLLSHLAKALIGARQGIVSGFGEKVGSLVLNGVIDELGDEAEFGEFLTLLPFPQGIGDATMRRKRWVEYRKKMLSQAGIALFLFGNKADDKGSVVLASGVIEEFKLATSMGLAVIPVGCTGYAARQLYDHVMSNFTDFYPKSPGLRQLFRKLDRLHNPVALANLVLEIIVKIKGN